MLQRQRIVRHRQGRPAAERRSAPRPGPKSRNISDDRSTCICTSRSIQSGTRIAASIARSGWSGLTNSPQAPSSPTAAPAYPPARCGFRRTKCCRRLGSRFISSVLAPQYARPGRTPPRGRPARGADRDEQVARERRVDLVHLVGHLAEPDDVGPQPPACAAAGQAGRRPIGPVQRETPVAAGHSPAARHACATAASSPRARAGRRHSG